MVVLAVQRAHQRFRAIGSDTGGSVRLPASYCGVFAFKPTYEKISRHGLVPYAQSLDTIGLFGDNIEDIRIVYGKLIAYIHQCVPSLAQNRYNQKPW